MIDADPRHTGGEAVTDTRWLGPAILRVAGWPIESLDGLRSQQLTKRIDDWIGTEDEIRRERDGLAAELYKITPRLVHPTVPRPALDLHRHPHTSLTPSPRRMT